MGRTRRASKPETADPIATLQGDDDIHQRAAAARDLSKFGEPEHLAILVERAQRDPSPAVRLGCAAAASDILSRYRLPPASEALSTEQRRGLLELFKGFDPAVNSGLFPILGTLGLPGLLQRIAAGLRDPRGDVRLGGAVGLLRMVSSASVAGDELTEQRVVNLLHDRRLKPDALAAVAQVCAAVGYRSALHRMQSLDLDGAHGEAVSKALDTMQLLETPLSGAWFSDGKDAGEVNPNSPQGEAFLILRDDGSALVRDDEGQWSVQADVLSSDVRRMYIRKVGEPEAGPAFQHMSRTWYMAGLNRVKELLEQEAGLRTVDWATLPGAEIDPTLQAVVAVIRPMLDDAAGPWRDLALLQASGGDLDGAIATLEQSLEAKRTPADTWFYLGEALAAKGKPAAAKAMWETCLEKARSKKADYVRLAHARLGSEMD
ncbi:MAG: HEAT repeat domain-containing protein [Myxococcota bacterium]